MTPIAARERLRGGGVGGVGQRSRGRTRRSADRASVAFRGCRTRRKRASAGRANAPGVFAHLERVSEGHPTARGPLERALSARVPLRLADVPRASAFSWRLQQVLLFCNFLRLPSQDGTRLINQALGASRERFHSRIRASARQSTARDGDDSSAFAGRARHRGCAASRQAAPMRDGAGSRALARLPPRLVRARRAVRRRRGVVRRAPRGAGAVPQGLRPDDRAVPEGVTGGAGRRRASDGAPVPPRRARHRPRGRGGQRGEQPDDRALARRLRAVRADQNQRHDACVFPRPRGKKHRVDGRGEHARRRAAAGQRADESALRGLGGWGGLSRKPRFSQRLRVGQSAQQTRLAERPRRRKRFDGGKEARRGFRRRVPVVEHLRAGSDEGAVRRRGW